MSNSKKKGVKRLGKPHRLNYNETLRATKVHAEAQGYDEGFDYAATETMDMVVITLHETFGFGWARLKKFDEAFHKLNVELAEMSAKDTADKEYIKAFIDNKLKEFVPPEEFKPWWQRYKYCIEPKLTEAKK